MVKTINNLFLDNNVIIGFIYDLDNLNPESEDIINSNNELHYSYHVKVEIDKVTSRKDCEYTRFFAMLMSKLRKHKNTEFLSKSSFHIFIDNLKHIDKLSIENMHYAFSYMWDKFGFGENQEVNEIRFKLNKFMVDFDNKHISKLDYFIEIAKYIPAHRNKDQQIIDRIHDKSLHNDLHEGDDDILFDLHEYSKNHPELKLILVSWDKNFIRVVDELLDILSFDEYICLKDKK